MEIGSEYDQEISFHKLQTKPRHRGEESNNKYETRGRQTKQINQLSLPEDDCKTRIGHKQTYNKAYKQLKNLTI